MKTRLEIYKEIYFTNKAFYRLAGLSEDSASRKANLDAVRQTDVGFYKRNCTKFEVLEFDIPGDGAFLKGQ